MKFVSENVPDWDGTNTDMVQTSLGCYEDGVAWNKFIDCTPLVCVTVFASVRRFHTASKRMMNSKGLFLSIGECTVFDWRIRWFTACCEKFFLVKSWINSCEESRHVFGQGV